MTYLSHFYSISLEETCMSRSGGGKHGENFQEEIPTLTTIHLKDTMILTANTTDEGLLVLSPLTHNMLLNDEKWIFLGKITLLEKMCETIMI